MPGPHDLFVRFTFGHPERAAAELRAALPLSVVSEVDWSTLRRESSSVVDPELRETETDLLFSARLLDGGTGRKVPGARLAVLRSSSTCRAGRSGSTGSDSCRTASISWMT